MSSSTSGSRDKLRVAVTAAYVDEHVTAAEPGQLDGVRHRDELPSLFSGAPDVFGQRFDVEGRVCARRLDHVDVVLGCALDVPPPARAVATYGLPTTAPSRFHADGLGRVGGGTFACGC